MARHNSGLRDLRKRLAAIPKAVRAKVETALDQSAGELVAVQRGLAPRDDGTLQASIRWSRSGELQRTVEAGGAATTRPVRQGADVDYD
ncbi:HK97 gp10 family phage protein, partial [Rhizobiaceae sp. 2RAB30]